MRRLLIPAGLVAAASIAVLGAATADGGPSSLARAYAAIARRRAIVHYTAVTDDPWGATTSEIWTSGSRSHSITTTLATATGYRFRTETAISGSRDTAYARGTIVTQRYRRRLPKGYDTGRCPAPPLW